MPSELSLPSVELPLRVHSEAHMALWQVSGAGQVQIRNYTWRLRGSTLLWVPAGMQHRVSTEADSVALPTFYPLSEASAELSYPFIVRVDEDLALKLLAQIQVTKTLIKPAAQVDQIVINTLRSRPKRLDALPFPASGPAQAVASQLRDNPGDERSAADFASELGISKRTLERAFPASVGMTFRQWRIAQRMEAAAHILREHPPRRSPWVELDEQALAEAVGYTNMRAFRRAFSQYFGCTPIQFVSGLPHAERP